MTDPREIADRQEIAELLYAYCRAVDRLDIPLGHAIWHEDGHADYGPDVYQGPGRGSIDLICAQHAKTLGHSHQVTNILVTLDGDRAGSEAYCFAMLRVGAPGRIRQMTVWSRYVDNWSRRDGRWGLDRRVAVREFDEIRDVTPMYDHDVARRDPSDPSYAAIGGLLR